jgi:neutral ceramidase
MLRCGVSEVNITPKLGMAIPGYFNVRLADGILDELYAHALAVESDGTAVILISCDAINMERQDVMRIRSKIADRTGIDPDSVSVSVTHLHTGGPTWAGLASKRDPEYLEFYTERVAQAGVEAYESLRPAKIGFSKGELQGISFVRRYFMKNGFIQTNPALHDPNVIRPTGEPDYTLAIARVEDQNGTLMAVLTNFALHADSVGGTKICADFPGVLSAELKKAYGENVVSLFFNGPCGNVNHIDRETLAKASSVETDVYQRLGHALFEKTAELLNSVQVTDDVPVQVMTKRFLINLRRPTAEQLEWAHAVQEGRPPMLEEEEGNSMFVPEVFARNILVLQEKQEFVRELEIKAVRIGDSVMAFWPGEMFEEFGKEVRKAYLNRTVMIAELTNGSIGCYIATKESFGMGGYEPRLTGGANAEESTGDQIVAETLKLFQKLI